jgi:hypothetical protein
MAAGPLGSPRRRAGNAGAEPCVRRRRVVQFAGMTPRIVVEPDPVIEAFKKDVDRTLLRSNLELTPEQPLRKLHAAVRGLVELRAAVQKSRR